MPMEDPINSQIPPVSVNSENPPKNIFKKYFLVFWELIKIIIIAAIIVLPIRYFLFQPFIVKGESMVPNFHSGDYLIVDELSYRIWQPERGDVVVLKYPLDPGQRFIKRVIALPGETIDVRNGTVTITGKNGQIVLQESYLPNDLPTLGNVHTTLGGDQYFVMGDNRQFSYDSRMWGALPKEDIVGKAFLRVFPIWDLSLIAEPSY